MVRKRGCAVMVHPLFLSFISAQCLCKLALNSFDAMAYTIISQPQSLSLSGNMPDIILSANAQVSFKLMLGDNIILDEAYSPDASAQIRIRIKEVVEQHLSVAIPTSNLFEQSESVKTFTTNIDGTAYTYTVVKGGVDADSVDATAFCTQNWLTWQMQSKSVKLNDPQWLTYYAAQPTTVKAKGYKADGTSQDITLASLTAGKMYTINVQYAHLLSLFSNAPSYVDIWAESASAVRLSYIQRFILNNDYDEFDDLFVFENSLGGIDSIRMIGSLQSVNESTSLSALFDEDTIEYDAEINKYFNKNTGFYPSESYRDWVDDFFTSNNRYHVRKGSIKRIVVKKSDVKTTSGDLNSASFTFAYTRQTKRLNLPRTETLPEVIEMVDPSSNLFFLAPRLSEFKQHTPDDASIFPIQSPSFAEWQKMSLFDLLTYFSTKFGITAGGGGGHVHPDVAMLNKLQVVEQYILYLGEKIKAGYADRTGECDNAIKWDNHTFGNYLDQPVRKSDTVTHKSVVSDDFDDASDFGGDGFGLLPGGVGKLNHLTVRKSMSVFELIVKKLQAVGGMLVISPGSGKVKNVEALADRYRITLEDADGEAAITFAADDLVRCQNFGSKTTKYYWRRCIEKGATYIDLSKDDCDTGSGIPEVGDELVQMGNATVTARQNIIIIDSTDKPKIAFYKGVNTYSLAGKERTRLGDLSELGIEDMGIATEAGRFSGKVVIGAGSTGLEQLDEWANKQSQIDGATSTAAAASATAAAAATAANTAKADAEASNQAIADMASDLKLSPIEKQSYKVIFDGYTSEKAKYDAQADQFSVSRTAYDAAYDALNAYLIPLLADLTTTSDIVSATFTSTLKSYTDARTDLTNAISAKAKALADIAQAKVDAIKIGGVNLLDRSSKEKGGAEYLEYANLVSIFDKDGIGQYVISFDLKASKEGSVNCYSSPGAESNFKYLWDSKGIAATTDYKRYSVVINVVNSNSASVWSPLSFYSGYGSGVNFWVRDVMVERGNTASAYDISQFDKSIGNLFLDSAIERTYGGRFYEIKTADILSNYVGEIVTVSMEVKSSETAPLRVYPYQNSGITVDYTNSYNIGTSYERISFTGRVASWSVPSGYTAGGIGLYLPNNPNGVVYVKNIQISLGYSDLVYKENVVDTLARIAAADYLKTALSQQTTTEGGLLLTSLIQLGEWLNGVFTAKAGVNGVGSNPLSPTFWGGGTLEDAIRTVNELINGTKSGNPRAPFVVSRDGKIFGLEGYIAGFRMIEKLLNMDTLDIGEVNGLPMIRVRDKSNNNRDAVIIADMPLSDPASLAGGGSIDVTPSYVTQQTSEEDYSYWLTQSGISTTKSALSSSVSANTLYSLIFNLNASNSSYSFVVDSRVTSNGSSLWASFTINAYDSNNTLLATIVVPFNGSSDDYGYTYILDKVVALSINTLISGNLYIEVKMHYSASRTLYDQDVRKGYRYTSNMVVAAKNNTKIQLLSGKGLIEIGRGFGALYGVNKYFQIQDKVGVPLLRARGEFEFNGCMMQDLLLGFTAQGTVGKDLYVNRWMGHSSLVKSDISIQRTGTGTYKVFHNMYSKNVIANVGDYHVTGMSYGWYVTPIELNYDYVIIQTKNDASPDDAGSLFLQFWSLKGWKTS